MTIELNQQEKEGCVSSLQKYCQEELEFELSDMRAKFLLEYLLKEIAPLAYNQGVKDAENYLRGGIEDLSGACFEPALTYWLKKKK